MLLPNFTLRFQLKVAKLASCFAITDIFSPAKKRLTRNPIGELTLYVQKINTKKVKNKPIAMPVPNPWTVK